MHKYLGGITILFLLFVMGNISSAQNSVRPHYSAASVYCGIEVGSKGVKMSIIEIGKNAQSTGAFKIMKDTSSNTDFISFTPSTFSATLNSLSGLYNKALTDYEIPAKHVFTVISSGVKMQAEKEKKNQWVENLIDSFRIKINEPNRVVEVVDVAMEARLSHLGIVPESRRYTTFLLDIGSGNTKGGFFPGGNTDNFKLFEINWGTKSTTNATVKRCEDDNSLENYDKQLQRVLYSAEHPEVIYAVNSSGAYALSDYIAVSGGIAWATATLMHPELLDKPVISVTYDDVVKFNEKLYSYYLAFSPDFIAKRISNKEQREAVRKAVSIVNKVFDQKSMMAGTGLLLKIMRQFVSAFETKQFYLIKNGQVGWVSAYVDQTINE